MSNPTTQVPMSFGSYLNDSDTRYWPLNTANTAETYQTGEAMGMDPSSGYATHFDDSKVLLYLGNKIGDTHRLQTDTPTFDFKEQLRWTRFVDMPLNSGTPALPDNFGDPAYMTDSGHVQLNMSGLNSNNLMGMVVDIGRWASSGPGSGGITSLTGSGSPKTVRVAPVQPGALLGLLVVGIPGPGTAGAAAKDLVVTAGAGAASTATSGTTAGGAGANFTLTTGAGGAASSTAGAAGGAGGGFNVTYGAGGAAAGTSAGGVGGGSTLTLGTGGASSKASSGGAGGAGGAFALTTGAGGASVSGAGGAGGALTLAGGAGGNATAGTGNGGAGASVIINGGAGGTSAGGSAGAAGVVKLANNVATPAAGSAAAFIQIGSTAGFGIYFGSGAPTVSAAQGSIYLRSDGSTTSTRLYVNTTGSTTWTNVTTAA